MNKKFFLFTMLVVIIIFIFSGCFIFRENNKYVAWVVGNLHSDGKAMLLYSEDSGENWTRQGSNILPEGKSLSDVYAVDKNIVWAVGNGNLVIKTINGGQTWEVVQMDQTASDSAFSSISIYENNIWISGEKGLIVSSANNGQDWTVHNLPASATEFLLQGIHAVNENLVYSVGNKSTSPYGYVLKTSDNGQNWEEINLPNNYNLSNGWIGVKATDENHIVINGGKGHFVVTANAGEQWVTGGPIFTADLNDLKMLYSSSYWVACDYDHIILTKDSGISWKSQPSAGQSNSFLVGIDALNEENALIVGQSAGYEQFGKILRTTNGGKDWKVVYTTNMNLYKVAIAKK